AEQNAIIQAARHGTNITAATLYCTDSPCIICSKMLINAGVAEVIYGRGYPDQLSLEMLGEAGIRFHHYQSASAT
ncbi:MAG TPA: deaminase, partial [Pelovirga sp.]|nr:deaminase [Pelovirga sp.]